jgi:hypothetical protein
MTGEKSAHSSALVPLCVAEKCGENAKKVGKILDSLENGLLKIQAF